VLTALVTAGKARAAKKTGSSSSTTTGPDGTTAVGQPAREVPALSTKATSNERTSIPICAYPAGNGSLHGSPRATGSHVHSALADPSSRGTLIP
jgi:hypothetical protein